MGRKQVIDARKEENIFYIKPQKGSDTIDEEKKKTCWRYKPKRGDGYMPEVRKRWMHTSKEEKIDIRHKRECNSSGVIVIDCQTVP